MKTAEENCWEEQANEKKRLIQIPHVNVLGKREVEKLRNRVLY